VEFALTVLVVYLLVVGGVELGRQIFVSQVLQDASRIAARELSVTPLPAGCRFEEALIFPNFPGPAPANCVPDPSSTVDVKAQIWDPDKLVIDLTCGPSDAQLEAFWAGPEMPIVNRSLRPAFISETVGARRLLRYPGALLGVTSPPPPPLACPAVANDLTVGIPRVTARDPDTGVETVDWIPVLTEVRADPADPDSGPFSYQSTGAQRGIVAVAIHFPFQSAGLSGFRSVAPTVEDPLPPNAGSVITADDATAVTNSVAPPSGTNLLALPSSASPYSGPLGLGTQFAFAGNVRPYRKLLVGQAIYRREVIQ